MNKQPKYFPKYTTGASICMVGFITAFICILVAQNSTSGFIPIFSLEITADILSITGIVTCMLCFIVSLVIWFAEEPLKTILLITTITCGLASLVSIVLGILNQQYIDNVNVEIVLGVGGFIGSLFGMNKILKPQT